LDLIYTELHKVHKLSRNDLLKDKNGDTTDDSEEAQITVICTPPHNPRNPAVPQIVKTHWQELGRRDATRDLLSWNVKFGYRRAPNLRDLLVRAKVNMDRPKPPPKKCKRPNTCKYCPLIEKSGRIYNRVHTFLEQRVGDAVKATI